MKVVREFEEQAESRGYQSMTKEAENVAMAFACSLTRVFSARDV